MSPVLFHKLAERCRVRKFRSLLQFEEKKRYIRQLEEKIANNVQLNAQSSQAIGLAWQRLTQRGVVSTQDLYEVRLMEAAIMRSILQLEAEAEQYQEDRAHAEKEANELSDTARYFGLKEKKMMICKEKIASREEN